MLEEARKHIQNQCLHALDRLLSLDMKEVVVRMLSESGKVFSPHQENAFSGWPLLTVLVAYQLATTSFPLPLVSTVAASVECLMCALDVLDDIEDGEDTPVLRELGRSRALSAAHVLLELSQQLLLATRASGAGPRQALRFLDIQTHAVLRACTGQHLDLHAEALPFSDMSQEQCLTHIALKSGTLVGMVCQLGALAVDAEEDVCEAARAFGEVEGMAQQLSNDAHDAYDLLHESTRPHQKSDMRRGKKTLPLVRAVQRGCRPFPLAENEGLLPEEVTILEEEITLTWELSRYYHALAFSNLVTLAGKKPIEQQLLDVLHFALP